MTATDVLVVAVLACRAAWVRLRPRPWRDQPTRVTRASRRPADA